MPRLLAGSLLLHLLVILVAVRAAQHGNEKLAANLPLVLEQVELTSLAAPGPKVVKAAPGAQRGGPGVRAVPAASQPLPPAVKPAAPPVVSQPMRQPHQDAPPAVQKVSNRAEIISPPALGGVVAAPGGKQAPPATAGGDGRGQAAAGRGGVARPEGGAVASRRSDSGTGPASGGAARRESYQALLKRLIEARKEYPVASRRRHEEGSCQRRFVLGRDGSLKQVEEVTRCGFPFLDEAATKAVASVGKFPPIPEGIEGPEASFTINITFTLANR
ncbi:TonB family protein [Geomonas sp.]|uniref:energy transducer TonB n=1 Tax=Geomonas sp. TaxID=2651584 RepID=UPI002B4A2165|nr:TonB family protein [Geomonas sp.]